VRLLATDCAQARESVSAQLDGELQELELDRLETHLRLCPDCAAWAEQVRDVTGRMRDAALEAPVLTGFVPARRSRRWAVSAEAKIIRSSPSAQNRRKGPIGACRSINPSRWTS
jgi:predicted anti-sigma-YlaC factor YlaD